MSSSPTINPPPLRILNSPELLWCTLKAHICQKREINFASYEISRDIEPIRSHVLTRRRLKTNNRNDVCAIAGL